MKIIFIILFLIILFVLLSMIWSLIIHEQWIDNANKRIDKKLGKNSVFKNIIKSEFKKVYNVDSYTQLKGLNFEYLEYQYQVDRIYFSLDYNINKYSINLFYINVLLYINDEYKGKMNIWFWNRNYYKIKKLHKKLFIQQRLDFLNNELDYLPKSIRTKMLFKKI